MSDLLKSPRDRYQNDPVFRTLVDTMVCCIDRCQTTPSEMRDAAIMASIIHEGRRAHGGIFMQKEVIAFLNGEKLETHDWYCGCGHWNGPELAVCALCGRTPRESI